MMFLRKTQLLSLVAATCALFILTSPVRSADNGATNQKKDAQSVLIEIRVKKWTKDLTLSAEQQKKFHALLEDEGKQVTKVDTEQNLSVTDRAIKIRELHEETYAKMKPLLTPTQLETFEKILAKLTKPKNTKPAVESPKQ